MAVGPLAGARPERAKGGGRGGPFSEVEAGRFLDALGGDGVHVALAQDDQVLTVHLDLVLVLGGEEHLVADLDLPHVSADGPRLTPHQPLRHLGGGGDQYAAAGAPVAVLLAERDQQAVVEHLDRESALPGSGGDVLGHADQRYPARRAVQPGGRGGGPRISTPYSCA